MAAAFTPSLAEQTLRLNLLTAINPIIQAKIEDLVQTPRLGSTMGFEELRPIFQKTILLFQTLSTANLDFVSEEKLKGLAGQASQMNNEFNQIRGFQANQFQNRQARIDQVKRAFDAAYNEVAPVLAVSQYTTLEPALAALKVEKDAFEQHKADVEKELSEILAKAKDVTAKVGIAEHASYFKEESNEHKRAAGIWLAGTVALAALTALWGWMNYGKTLGLIEQSTKPSGGSLFALPAGALVQLAVAKLIIFSILFSAVLWAGRIYRAHRHNYVVNKHRLNALSTFEAFAKAAQGDAETKNAVLLQATQCIFNPQATGYIGQEKDSEGHSSVLEIFRSMPSSKA